MWADYGAFRLPSLSIGQRLPTLVFCVATSIAGTNILNVQSCCDQLPLLFIIRVPHPGMVCVSLCIVLNWNWYGKPIIYLGHSKSILDTLVIKWTFYLPKSRGPQSYFRYILLNTQWTFSACMSPKNWCIFNIFAFLENHVIFATLWEMGPLRGL